MAAVYQCIAGRVDGVRGGGGDSGGDDGGGDRGRERTSTRVNVCPSDPRVYQTYPSDTPTCI